MHKLTRALMHILKRKLSVGHKGKVSYFSPPPPKTLMAEMQLSFVGRGSRSKASGAKGAALKEVKGGVSRSEATGPFTVIFIKAWPANLKNTDLYTVLGPSIITTIAVLLERS